LAVTLDVDLHGVLEEKGAAVDDVALGEAFENESIAFELHVDFTDSKLNED